MANSFNNYVSISGNILSAIDASAHLMPERADKSAIYGKDLVWLYEACSRRAYANDSSYSTTRSIAADGSTSWNVDHDCTRSKLDLDSYWSWYHDGRGAAFLDAGFVNKVKDRAEYMPSMLSCIDEVTSTVFFERDAYDNRPYNVPKKLLNAVVYEGYSFLSDFQNADYNSPLQLSNVQTLFDATKFDLYYCYTDFTLPNETWHVCSNEVQCSKTNSNGPTDMTCATDGSLNAINGYSNPRIGFYARYEPDKGGFGSIDTSLLGNPNFILVKVTTCDFMVPSFAFVFVEIHYIQNLNQTGDKHYYKYAAIPVQVLADGKDSYGNPVYKAIAPTLKDLYIQAGFAAPDITGLTKKSYWQVSYTITFVGWVFKIQDA